MIRRNAGNWRRQQICCLDRTDFNRKWQDDPFLIRYTDRVSIKERLQSGFLEVNKKEDILNSLVNITHLRTCREEYRLAHDDAVLSNMVSKDNYPDIPIILVTHSSEEAIKENMEFGRNSRPFAVRIEQLWQEIMKVYLGYSEKAIWIQAKKSTHYIHLTEPEIIVESLNIVEQIYWWI